MMRPHHTHVLGGPCATSPSLARSLPACLLLTSCGGSGDDAKASASSKATATHTSAKPAPLTSQEAAAEKAKKDYEKAQKNFEKALKDADNALGETIGVQEGTYEATNDQPDYEDVTEALDDEYIAPGTYTTKGPADPASSCYWARMGDASGGSILANDLTTGRAIVSLKEGEFFKTSGCKPWTRSGD
ncbi:hypothetical protein ABZV34_16600 [Streptomyces sp. NPDC005195]|uniref:hypothetical protein n=1 Tax=Streptomyces sp. NPDC005195 TaxID=3154561 RepID=UPI0033ABF24B